jgi:hypothetical protein
VSVQPVAVLELDQIQRVFVRERLPFGGESTFFTVEIETTPEATYIGESLAALGGRLVAISIGGSVVGVEETSSEWVERLRIGTFTSEAGATELAKRIAGAPVVEHLTEAEANRERQRFLEFASDFFWVNVCEPDGDTARKQDALWARTKQAFPEVLERIDCARPPAP